MADAQNSTSLVDWKAFAEKHHSLFRVSKNFNFSERYVRPMDVNMQREFWSEPEIKALRDLMRLELQWPEITTQLAQKTGLPLKSIECVKMFGLRRHQRSFISLERARRRLCKPEDRDLTTGEQTRLNEWLDELDRWPDIHISLSRLIDRFATTYRIERQRVHIAVERIQGSRSHNEKSRRPGGH